jgi:hypothetical protein
MQQQIENGRPFEPRDLYAPDDFAPHWAPEMTDEQYHADSIRLILASPKAFYQGHFKGKQKEETNDMRLGRIIHLALLEGEKFREKYMIEPVFQGYTQKGELTSNPNCKEVQQKKAAWYADLPPGRVVVTEEELEQITGIIESVMEHPQGAHVFTHGVPEVAGFYRDPDTGIRTKIKPDFRGNDMFMVTDYKTAQSCDQKLFGAKAFGPLRYDIQLWMYAYGTSIIENKPMPENLFFMVSEKVWPFEAAVFFMTPEQMNQAKYDYHRAMAKLKTCIDTNKWPMRQQKMEPLWTPKFFIDNDVDMHEKELDDAGV